MCNEGKTIAPSESDVSDPARQRFASITVQPRDLRPYIVRRWSATAIAGIWSVNEFAFGDYFWRARSKEKLVAKGVKMLRREALKHGIRDPVITVTDTDALSSAEVLEAAGRRNDDFGFGRAAPVEPNFEVEVISVGARGGR